MHLRFQKQTSFVKLLHENFLQLIFLYLFYNISRKDTKKKQIQRDPICTKLQQKNFINQDNVQWLHEQKIQKQALHSSNKNKNDPTALHSPLLMRYFYKKKTSYHQPKHFHKHLHIISRVTISSLHKLLNLVLKGSTFQSEKGSFQYNWCATQ